MAIIYRSDEQSIDYFKKWGKDSLRKSPIHNSLKKQDELNKNMDGWGAHSYGEINPFKVCEIGIGPVGEPSDSTWWYGNWRNTLGVDKNVFLWPTEKVWSFAFSNNYESAYEKLDQQGMLSKLSQLTEILRSAAMVVGGETGNSNANGGRFISKYKEAPAWTGTTTLSLDSNLTFNFRFGQAGLFSGKEEVVRPIMSLLMPFAPRANKDFQNYYQGPLPTAPAYFMEYLKRFAGETRKEVIEAFKGGSDASGGEETDSDGNPIPKDDKGLNSVINNLTEAEDSIRQLMNDTIEHMLASKDNRLLHIRIGNIKLPPMVVRQVSWKFDMTHTDEEGYPTAGSVSLGGLESYELASSELVRSTITLV
jgi:hypothetical protein